MTLTVSCGIRTSKSEGEDVIQELSIADEQVAWNNQFPGGQLHQVAVFNRCLADEEIQKLYGRQQADGTRAEPKPAPATPALLKVELESTLTWKELNQRAVDSGGSLPARTDLILAAVKAGNINAWVPVSREDGQECDFVQLGQDHPHPIYISHVDCFGKRIEDRPPMPRIGDSAYFYMKQA